MDERHRFCMQEFASKAEAAMNAQRLRVAQEASEELRRLFQTFIQHGNENLFWFSDSARQE